MIAAEKARLAADREWLAATLMKLANARSCWRWRVDTVIVTKLSFNELMIWAVDHDSGKPLSDVRVRVSGPGVTPGYVNPEHDRDARTEDGWLITGDLGRIDSDGYVFVTGRAKDVIIRGCHNIDPALIEEPLLQSRRIAAYEEALLTFSLQDGRVRDPQVVLDSVRDEAVSGCVARAINGAEVGGSGHGTASIVVQ